MGFLQPRTSSIVHAGICERHLRQVQRGKAPKGTSERESIRRLRGQPIPDEGQTGDVSFPSTDTPLYREEGET